MLSGVWSLDLLVFDGLLYPLQSLKIGYYDKVHTNQILDELYPALIRSLNKLHLIFLLFRIKPKLLLLLYATTLTCGYF